MAHLPRELDSTRLRNALTRAPVVVLTGPRQVGKSTLARLVVEPDPDHVFDLEDPRDLSRLAEPTLTLPNLRGTVVIDEAQHLPGLFPVLRVLADADRRPGRFLVLGSASPALVGMASESLAGRVAMLELGGFRVVDVGPDRLETLWQRGGLPPAFDADDGLSASWRDDYIATFLERDLAQLGIRVPATTMRRFWTMLAHFHGQTWNGAELARALGVSQPTVRRYLDALTDALVIRQLQPWHANISKRQVRAPKVYLRDSGLLHRLLGIATPDDLFGHPKVGASWEGFIIEQLIGFYDVKDASYWATQAGAEIDLRIELVGLRLGVEVKRTDRPATTRSIHSAVADLELDHVAIVHAGARTFRLSDKVTAVAAVDACTGHLTELVTR